MCLGEGKRMISLERVRSDVRVVSSTDTNQSALTKHDKLEIFGGLNMMNEPNLKQFLERIKKIE
jgi:hypothetical protein